MENYFSQFQRLGSPHFLVHRQPSSLELTCVSGKGTCGGPFNKGSNLTLEGSTLMA